MRNLSRESEAGAPGEFKHRGASQENNEKIVMQEFLWICDGQIPLEPEWRYLSINLLNAPVCSSSCVVLMEKSFMSH